MYKVHNLRLRVIPETDNKTVVPLLGQLEEFLGDRFEVWVDEPENQDPDGIEALMDRLLRKSAERRLKNGAPVPPVGVASVVTPKATPSVPVDRTILPPGRYRLSKIVGHLLDDVKSVKELALMMKVSDATLYRCLNGSLSGSPRAEPKILGFLSWYCGHPVAAYTVIRDPGPDAIIKVPVNGLVELDPKDAIAYLVEESNGDHAKVAKDINCTHVGYVQDWLNGKGMNTSTIDPVATRLEAIFKRKFKIRCRNRVDDEPQGDTSESTGTQETLQLSPTQTGAPAVQVGADRTPSSSTDLPVGISEKKSGEPVG